LDFLSEFADRKTVLSNIKNWLQTRYEYLGMFHCCRPISVESYYRDGIKTLDMSYANQLFENIVRKNPAFSSVTSEHFKSAFDDMADSIERNGHVYFGLDDRFLKKYCPHYLKFGNEYLQALAVRIDAEANTNVKEFLQSNGKPTIFSANIPLSNINDEETDSLVSSIFTTWLYNHAHETSDSFLKSFGISLTNDLKPEQIITHFHPVVT